MWFWILYGLQFDRHRMCAWIMLGDGFLGGGIVLFALNFMIGGVIVGFILALRLITAVWYVLFLLAPVAAENKPLTASERKIYRRITLAAGTVILCLALIYNLVHNLVSARTMMIFVCGEGTMVISMIVAAITSAAKKTDLNTTSPQ